MGNVKIKSRWAWGRPKKRKGPRCAARLKKPVPWWRFGVAYRCPSRATAKYSVFVSQMRHYKGGYDEISWAMVLGLRPISFQNTVDIWYCKPHALKPAIPARREGQGGPGRDRRSRSQQRAIQG